jgi:hypothetical protein
MALRQRKMVSKNPSGSSAPTTSDTPSPKGNIARAPFTLRVRVLLFAVPVLFGWFIVLNRRQSTRPLPSTFAICSARNRTQIITMDSASSRVQCVVVDKGLVAGRGTLAEVREEWGDVDTKGKVHSGKGGGIKILFLRKGEALLPGLCVKLPLVQRGMQWDGN